MIASLPTPLTSALQQAGGLVSDAWRDFFNKLATRLALAYDAPGAILTKAANYTHNSSGNWLLIPFDTASEDNDTICDTVNSRLVCKTAGMYRIWSQVSWAFNAVGDRHLAVMLNGAPGVGSGLGQSHIMPVTTAGDTIHGSGFCRRLAKNDYVALYGYQSSGGNLVVDAAATRLGMEWLRP